MQSHKQFLWRKGHEFALQKLGMSVLVAFDCKFEKPIRGCDLKVIEKMVLSNHASAVSNGVQVKFSIEPI